MARNKESLVLLLDVGPKMHGVLLQVEKVCAMLLEKKLLYNKFDEVGIVLFGTKETKNDLTVEVGGYENIVVLRNIKVVDGDLVDALESLPQGTVPGDFLDAIVVGMDMLIKKYGPTNKGKKRLCLITNALSRLRDPFEGTKEDQVCAIARQMTEQAMKLECIVVRGELSGDADKNVMDENDQLLDLFTKRTCAKTLYVENATSLLGALRTRSVAPVTIFRGDLEISSSLKIKIWVYKKTSEEKFPTLKKYSDKAPATDKFATREIKIDYEYRSIHEPDKIVPPEQRIKGYRYGPEVVPISSDAWEAVKFTTEKSVKLLGFTDAKNIRRQYYMKDVNIFTAEPGKREAMIAVSALAKAMKEMNKVAIVRCVWRQGQAGVVIGVLTPNISVKDNIPDSLYFNVLPFAEDVREFQFPSFKNLPEIFQPSEEQQEAADNLVKMFDLAPPAKEENLKPDLTPNPVLERFYHFLELKAKNPDAAVPPLDVALKSITEPDAEFVSQNKSVIDEFQRCFELKANIKKKKSTRSTRERPSGSDDEKEAPKNLDEGKPLTTTRDNSAVKVENRDEKQSNKTHFNAPANNTVAVCESIENIAPIQEFEAMLSRRDSPDWVVKAIRGLKTKILDLLDDSIDQNNYDKALACLFALRKGCVLEQEPAQFNNFLGYLNRYCKEQDLHDFCEFLGSKGMTLITKTEAPDSDVPDEAGRSYLVNRELKVE
ncbi:ATP-dependent DNA helicase 2 subunit KU80 isoform X3 [Amaranthus tricolor]|uniref:ATP-dependent DNA helicase 2 subunit KU80 isoform X3 n=1 Tax=Amaranthus tricolor TaxID=29722 RepID=UPI00258D0DB6|nr:ATP-dependent DNA helicase 2 subunit KU80 isoform X3 [Amaranthus tricolor]